MVPPDNKTTRSATVGAAENVIPVPLFAELAGYGPFAGRRNLGVHDPLYCRVLTVNDGSRRNVVIVTDTIASDEKSCRVLRMELATDFALYPESIMFVATHSHSSTAPGNSVGVGYQTPNEEFTANWRSAIRQTLTAAIANEEPVRAFAGRARLGQALGRRRTTAADAECDTDIRFVKLIRNDGSTKVLLHNHAMHGVAFGRTLQVSADWMGAANAEIKARGLAEMPIFLYGTAGDVNPIRQTCDPEKRHLNLEWIAGHYADDLEKAWGDAEEIPLAPVSAVLETVELPTEKVDPAECRGAVAKLRAMGSGETKKLSDYIGDRLTEMAALAECGHDFRVLRDLQAMKMGDLALYSIPGEAFLNAGKMLMERSDAGFPVAISVANGHAGYLPSREMFEQYPDMCSGEDFGRFGFYEVWFGPGSLRAKFKPDVEEFIVDKLLELGSRI